MENRTTLHVDAEKLIPELSLWNNGNGIDLDTWLGTVAHYDHAIGYAALFWPDFVLHDDCVFLKVDLKNYEDWMRHSHGDKTKVERVINHRHILDCFRHSKFEPTKEIVVHLQQILKDMWSCKLQRDFPDRRCMIECYGDGSADLLSYQITVFQDRRPI